MFIIKDTFQEYMQNKFDKNTLILINEILFYGIFVYYYYFGPIQDSQQNFTIVKYIAIIFILKYTLSYITNIKEVTIDEKNIKNEKTYFQFNSKIAIFSILILFLSLNQNIIVTLSILFSYALLSSSADYGYTTDNLITIIIVYFLYSLKLI
jgi:hypothetical protein